MRRVFDCFLFYNELDLLEIRLREMAPAVDRFVLVEAEETFQGKAKPLFFAENRQRFQQWAEKIIHIAVPAGQAPPGNKYGDAWGREHFQRDQIARGLSEARGEDLVIVSDVDEIIRREALAKAVAEFRAGEAIVFLAAMHRFRLDYFDPDVVWPGARMLEKRKLSSPQRVRHIKARASRMWQRLGLSALGLRQRNYRRCGFLGPVREIANAGWHFSSLGGFEAYRQKVDAFSHVEYKNSQEYNSPASFDAWVKRHRMALLSEMPACVQEGGFQDLLARGQPLESAG